MAYFSLPLVLPKWPYVEFPAHRLGDILNAAANAIARRAQVPLGLAGQSVLVAAALAVQGHVDADVPQLGPNPTSLNAISLVASTDGKGQADKLAMAAFRKFEGELADKHALEMANYKDSHKVWKVEEARVLGDKKLSRDGRMAALKAIGAEPVRPLEWVILHDTATIEGLQLNFQHSRLSLGLVPTDGAYFTAGYAMNPERLLNTAAYLSLLWDGARARKLLLAGVQNNEGVRLSSHIMLQPGIGASMVGNRELNEQGLLSRFLVIEPDGLAGTRLTRDPDPQDDALLKVYHDRLYAILCEELPMKPGPRRMLDPSLLPMSGDAYAVWRSYRDHIERKIGPGGYYRQVRAVAGRSAQMAARFAGIITAMGEPSDQRVLQATEILADVMSDAVALAEWYLEEALRLASAVPPSPTATQADEVLLWLTTKWRGTGDIELRMLRANITPVRLRDAVTLRAALFCLVKSGELEQVEQSGRGARWRLPTSRPPVFVDEDA
ncbi:MAG: hypothetical protein JWM36_5 [Hyphomicrobiales bacterium]|nr:hypothetical protein [Hyphomicrobiales bacterium]